MKKTSLTKLSSITNKLGEAHCDKPTFDMYGFVQSAYDHFNSELFNNELPQCLLTLQREKSVCGYFSSDRWQSKTDTKHEIALNPYYFVTEKPLELFQTIVHEMCHLWQHEFGKPSRSGYHNKEWADKMESLGLMPSDTGEPGGKRTGQKMGDYPIDGGAFHKSCIALANRGNTLPYIDRVRFNPPSSSQLHNAISLTIRQEDNSFDSNEASLFQPFSEQFELDEEFMAEQETVRAAKQKTTFQCPICMDKAWGKPSLELLCAKCNAHFEAI